MSTNIDLERELQIDKVSFEARVKEIKYMWDVQDIKTEGRFFYLAFKNGEPSIDEFVEYLYSKLINFCIPIKEQEKAKKRFLETGQYRQRIYKKSQGNQGN